MVPAPTHLRTSLPAARGRGWASMLLMLAVLLLPQSAWSQTSWAVAQRDDAAIQSFVGKLTPHADGAPGASDAAAVILYKQFFFDVFDEDHKYCRNVIALINDPSSLDPLLTSPYLGVEDEALESHAFRVRGDSVDRIKGGDIDFEAGDGDVRRAQVVFGFSDLKPGDIIGWSVVVEGDGPVFLQQIPASDRYPVVYSSCRVQTSGQEVYEMRSVGIKPSEFSMKSGDVVKGRPTSWKGNMKNLVAIPGIRQDGPFDGETPVFELALDETWVEVPNMFEGWVSAMGWNTCVLILNGIGEAFTEKADGLDVHASALTTGLTTDQDKERAVCEFVRTNVKLLEGDGIARRGRREPKDVLKAKEGTEAEMAMLMMAMLSAVGVETQLAAVRPEYLGDPANDFRSLVQFRTMVIRGGDESPRFYAPQCVDCEPGQLPAEWGDATMLSPVLGLGLIAEEYREAANTAAFASGEVDMREMAADQEKQNWRHMEKASQGVM